jgi:peptidoglycan/LPS O-acetylase OafA/YrhL
MSLRKVTKARGSFPNDEAVFKLLYLALRNIAKKWTMSVRDDFIRAGRKFWPYLSIAPVVLVLAHIYPVEQSGFSITVGFTIFYLTFGGLVVLARAYPAFGSSGPQRLIAAMGVYSYTIYLAHSVIYELPGINSARVLVQSNFGNTGDRFLFFFASIMLGILLSHAIERPFLKLRAKWLPAAPWAQRAQGGSSHTASLAAHVC